MHKDPLYALYLHFCTAKSAQVREALAHFRCPNEAWHALCQRDRSLSIQIKAKHAHIDRSLQWLSQSKNDIIGWHQVEYPQTLRHVDSPPPFLFITGSLELLWHPQIAIVGSRQPSASGVACAYHFAQCLAQKGYTITSGLARGIDASAHEGALSCGKTIAALATGPDLAFPSSNRELFEQIAESGTLITEHAPGIPALRSHFPARNRIIAGLSQGTLVIEAAIRSGALITARIAAELNKEVMAVPGSIHNPMAFGCHQLIREGAYLVEQPDEVAHILSCSTGSNAKQATTFAQNARSSSTTMPKVEQFTEQQRQIWQALGHDSLGIDTICLRTALTVADISSILVGMELSGWVENQFGRYHRCH